MNKKQILEKYFNNKEIVRQINNYLTNQELKDKIIKLAEEEGYNKEEIIKNLKEEEKTFILGNNVFFKERHEKITIANIKVLSQKILYGKTEILIKDIKEINEKEFKTKYATYYIGSE